MAKKTNIEINGKQYYRVTRTIGKKADGTPVRKAFYGSGINEANKKADEYINDIKNGLITNFECISINDAMYTWLFDFLLNSASIKPSTFQRYEGIYRKYIKNSSIAGLRVYTISSLQLQQFYNKLSKDFSYSQINTLNTILKIFFNWCIDNGYMLKNPCLKVNIKKDSNKNVIEKKEVEILTPKEIKTIKEYLKDTNFELLFLLDLGTGLRLGELLALDWNHINLRNKTINVEKSVKEVYVYDSPETKHIETIFQKPKTKTSIRTITIPNNLVELLKIQKNKTGLLFKDENGHPIRGRIVYSRWNSILNTCNIPHKKFHAIRHTYASMLLKNGVDIETVAELMGHSTITITQIYLHSTSDQKQKAVNKLNNLFQTNVLKKC